jgi:hypothetical protein
MLSIEEEVTLVDSNGDFVESFRKCNYRFLTIIVKLRNECKWTVAAQVQKSPEALLDIIMIDWKVELLTELYV